VQKRLPYFISPSRRKEGKRLLEKKKKKEK
jgi:hypothetical protein